MTDGALTEDHSRMTHSGTLPTHAAGSMKIHVVRCMRLSWSSKAGWADLRVGGILPAFKNLIHLGPFLAITSQAFLHGLLLTSLEILWDRMDRMADEDGRRAKLLKLGDAQLANSNSHGDGTGMDVDDLNADRMDATGSDGPLATGLSISICGFPEMVWLMRDLPQCLLYWREASSVESGWKGLRYPSTEAFSASLHSILTTRKADMDSFDSRWHATLEAGNRTSGSEPIFGLFLDALVEVSVLSPEDRGSYTLESLAAMRSSAAKLDEARAWFASTIPLQLDAGHEVMLKLYSQPWLWRAVSEVAKEACSEPLTAQEGLLMALTESEPLLRLISRYIPPLEMLDNVMSVLHLHTGPSNTGEDAQMWMTNFGQTVLFVRQLCAEFRLDMPSILDLPPGCLNLEHLDTAQGTCLNDWIQALFGEGSIAEDLLRTTNPFTLFHLAPTIMSQAIYATAAKVLSLEKLHNGISYFPQPLLHWTLAPVIIWLCGEIDLRGSFAGILLEVLQSFINAADLPVSILKSTQADLTRTLANAAREDWARGLILSETDSRLWKLRYATLRIRNAFLPLNPGDIAPQQLPDLIWRRYLEVEMASSRMCEALVAMTEHESSPEIWAAFLLAVETKGRTDSDFWLEGRRSVFALCYTDAAADHTRPGPSMGRDAEDTSLRRFGDMLALARTSGMKGTAG